MDTRKMTNLTFALLTIALAAIGCTEDEEQAPSGPGVVNLDGGGGLPLPPVQVDGGTPEAAVATPDGGGATGECSGPNGCYSCKPSTNEQLLNSCAEGCRPFDNSTRLPGYQAGTLPPLAI